jgi:hypothetical protein
MDRGLIGKAYGIWIKSKDGRLPEISTWLIPESRVFSKHVYSVIREEQQKCDFSRRKNATRKWWALYGALYAITRLDVILIITKKMFPVYIVNVTHSKYHNITLKFTSPTNKWTNKELHVQT